MQIHLLCVVPIDLPFSEAYKYLSFLIFFQRLKNNNRNENPNCEINGIGVNKSFKSIFNH